MVPFSEAVLDFFVFGELGLFLAIASLLCGLMWDVMFSIALIPLAYVSSFSIVHFGSWLEEQAEAGMWHCINWYKKLFVVLGLVSLLIPLPAGYIARVLLQPHDYGFLWLSAASLGTTAILNLGVLGFVYSFIAKYSEA